MIVSEEEAKTKRCQEGFGQPLYNSRTAQTNDIGAIFSMAPVHGASYGGFGSPSHCIGSACMAWRWAGLLTLDGRVPDGTKGYCGKAGHP